MAIGGRKPTPTRIKIARGNPGKRPYNTREATPDVKLPPCPSHLSPEAHAEWRRLGKQLVKQGMMSVIDKGGLALWCQSWGRWVESEEALRKHGMLIKSPTGYLVESPYLGIAKAAMETMRKLIPELGLSQSSRSRVVPSEAPEESRLQKFISAAKAG